MEKRIEIWRKRLIITKEKIEYLVCDDNLDLFIHADKLFLGEHGDNKGWLILEYLGIHVGSIWINTDTDMKTVEKFLEETK